MFVGAYWGPHETVATTGPTVGAAVEAAVENMVMSGSIPAETINGGIGNGIVGVLDATIGQLSGSLDS